VARSMDRHISRFFLPLHPSQFSTPARTLQ
jgi:hypothetical protein